MPDCDRSIRPSASMVVAISVGASALIALLAVVYFRGRSAETPPYRVVFECEDGKGVDLRYRGKALGHSPFFSPGITIVEDMPVFMEHWDNGDVRILVHNDDDPSQAPEPLSVERDGQPASWLFVKSLYLSETRTLTVLIRVL
jgi:hypothetical protein